jgi:hypothetical protein
VRKNREEGGVQMIRRPIDPWKVQKPRKAPAFSPPPQRDYAAEQIIANAIRSKTVITFSYEGDGRTFNPHVMWETKSGNVVVYGFQTQSTDPFSQNGSHTFTVSKIELLRLTGDHFAKDPSFDVGKYRDNVLAIINGF